MAKKRKTRRSASHSALGCLFWVSLIVALGVAAYAAREPLREVLGRLFDQGAPQSPTVTVKPLSQEVKGTAPTEEAKSSQVIGSPPAVPTEDRAAITAPAQRENQTQEIPAVRKTRLFFASVGTDGKVSVKGVIRSIPVSDSPLRDTILALLKGPTSQEVNLGMLNMIPVESRLLGAAVRGDTAYLDFNENFRFNTLGAEGLNAELRQVVYAATEFPTVKNVQFLIEGKIVQYLGSEGIRIDSPLSRQSFQE